jgi:archaemetzincin
MKAIHLVRAGIAQQTIEIGVLDRLAASLARVFRVSCHVRENVLDVAFAIDEGRGQYHSTAILGAMQASANGTGVHLLAVTSLDLYVPVLTFVFGEAQLAGPCGIVSTHRLAESFYGLPANTPLEADRLLKEAVHELGHTLGLRHCRDWRCAMASTHAVERLDVKEPRLCRECKRAAG